MTPDRYARLAELFADALDATATARAELLEAVRNGDPDLAARLAELLSIDAVAATREAGDRPSAAAGDPPAPTIAGFAVGEVLGRGGMAVVYAAEQLAPCRPVAVKVLRAASHGALRRFAIEAAALARLDHPGIARVVAFGEADGRPYLILERIDGIRLDLYAERAGLDHRARVRLLADVCDAVHHAHVRGVIHRDLKPSNILVRVDGRVAVLDFGVARVASELGETRAGELVGTPAYMSPEQALLRPHQVDARSDVYALGVVGYELLTGSLPYELDDRLLTEITRIIAEEPARPAGARTPELRGDLEAILGRALAKAADDRYPSAAALADDLRRHLEHRTVSARSPRAWERVARFARRRPSLAAALGGVAVLVIAAAAAITALWLRADRAREQAAARADRNALLTARLTVAVDPTLAIARLRELRGAGLGAEEAAVLVDEAIGVGVAADVLRGAHDDVRWVEPFAGSRWIATTGYEGAAAIWDRDARAARIVDNSGWVRKARPSPDGRWLLLIGDTGGVAFVALDDHAGVATRRLPGHRADVRETVWSRREPRAVTGDDAGEVRVWSPDRPEQNRVLGNIAAAVEALALSADGAVVVAGGRDGSVWRWDVSVTGGGASVANAHVGEVETVAERDGAVIAVGADGAITRWRPDGDRLILEHRIDTAPARAAAIAPDRAVAALGGASGALWRVDLDAGTAAVVLEHDAPIRSVAISADGAVVASGDDDGLVQVADVVRGRRLRLRGHVQRIRQLAVSPDGDLLFTASGDEVRVWALDRSPRGALIGDAAIEALRWDDRAAALVVTDATGHVRRWSPTKGVDERLGLLPLEAARAVTAGGQRLTSDEAGAVWAHGAGTARKIAQLDDDVRHLTCSPAICAAASDNGVVVASADRSPTALQKVARHTTRVTALAVGQDDPVVCSVAADRTLSCVDMRGGATIATRVHTGAPIALLVHAGGLDVIGADGVLERWRDRRGSSVTVAIPAGASAASSLGRLGIAVGFVDGTVRRYAPLGRSWRELAAQIDEVTSAAVDGSDFATWPTQPP